jgi:Flp pilus assembly protein TadD
MSRVYLFSLKALGVVRLRRGRVADAERVLTKLLELDPQDEIGGRNFLDIATSFREQE